MVANVTQVRFVVHSSNSEVSRPSIPAAKKRFFQPGEYFVV